MQAADGLIDQRDDMVDLVSDACRFREPLRLGIELPDLLLLLLGQPGRRRAQPRRSTSSGVGARLGDVLRAFRVVAVVAIYLRLTMGPLLVCPILQFLALGAVAIGCHSRRNVPTPTRTAREEQSWQPFRPPRFAQLLRL